MINDGTIMIMMNGVIDKEFDIDEQRFS